MGQTLTHLFTLVEDATEELIELHQALVRTPSVNTGAPDSGNETEVCRLLEERLGAEGIPNRILESAPARGNFLACLSEGGRPRLLLMSHTDVVPVEDEDQWQLPAFSGEIVNGAIYGRGSDDAKSLVSTGAMTLILLKRAGISLQGELRFLAAADEEAGGRYGIAWLADNHPNEIRADWGINEGGGKPVQTSAGLAYLISVGEKGRMEAHFNIGGRSAHGARPWLADNALYKLGRLLKQIQDYEPEIDLRQSIFEYLHLFGFNETPTPKNLDRVLATLDDQNRDLASTLMALSRMTISPTMISAGIKSNSIPASANLTCDIRTLPHQSEEYVQQELEKILKGGEDVNLTLDITAIANSSPADSPFVSQLRQATKLALGEEDVPLIPSLTVGFTDSRCVRPLGTQVYGFSPLLPHSDTVRPGVHGVDEMMEIDNLVFRTKMQIALAYLTLGVK